MDTDTDIKPAPDVERKVDLMILDLAAEEKPTTVAKGRITSVSQSAQSRAWTIGGGVD